MLLAEGHTADYGRPSSPLPFSLEMRGRAGPASQAWLESAGEKISPWEDKMPVSLSCKSRKLAEFITDGNGIQFRMRRGGVGVGW